MTTITCLIDNNANAPLRSEHGLSLFIEHKGTSVLFDTGQSDAFLENAAALGCDIADVGYIVLSHGHYDHSGGLGAALSRCRETSGKPPRIILHPDALCGRSVTRDTGMSEEIGMSEENRRALKDCPTVCTRTPLVIAPGLLFLGEIPRPIPEARALIGTIRRNGHEEPDPILDDSALICLSPSGLVIITGCSHSGIANIILHALNITGQKKVFAVIGGLHLKEAAPACMEPNMNCLRERVCHVYSNHCTGDALLRIGFGHGFPAGDRLMF